MRYGVLFETFIWPPPPKKNTNKNGGKSQLLQKGKNVQMCTPNQLDSYNDSSTSCFVITLLNTMFIFNINLDLLIKFKWNMNNLLNE